MRTSSRIIEPTPPPTEAEARAAMGAYIEAYLAVKEVQVSTNQSLERIKECAAETMRPYQDIMARQETLLMQYAEANQGLFLSARKTEIYGGHKIGYQTTPPAVTLTRPTGAKKKQTLDGLLDALKAAGEWAKELIRTKEEPDKEAILAKHREAAAKAREEKTLEASTALRSYENQLAAVGCAVTQTEKFVIDLSLPKEPEATATPNAEAS